MDDPIGEYRKRVRGYENIDGTQEMFFGAMFLSIPLIELVEQLRLFDFVPWGSLLAMYAVWVPALALTWWGTRIIKRRITYARTGYLLQHRDIKNKVMAMALSATIAAAYVLALHFIRRQYTIDVSRLFMLVVGVATYAVLIAVASPEHKWKFFVAALLAICSVGLAFAGWENSVFRATAGMLFGLAWLGSGLITLFLYIRRTRPATWESE